MSYFHSEICAVDSQEKDGEQSPLHVEEQRVEQQLIQDRTRFWDRVLKKDQKIARKEVQEFFRLRSDDPKGKALFLRAAYDDDQAFDPQLSAHLLSKLSSRFDVSYHVVSQKEEICIRIKEARKSGKVVYVIIQAHGDRKAVVLQKINTTEGGQSNVVSADTLDFATCFSNLDANGKVILLSCSTGAGSLDDDGENLAQQIANAIKRPVVAPRSLVSGLLVTDSADDHLEVYHPDDIVTMQNRLGFPTQMLIDTLFEPTGNLFSLFRPVFRNCSLLPQPLRNAPEFDVALDVSNALRKKDFLRVSRSGEVAAQMQLCHDDPRNKVLFFLKNSWNDLEEKSLQSIVKMLTSLADKFDVKYQIVHSWEALCSSVKKAARLFSVSQIWIQQEFRNDIVSQQNASKGSFSDCFSDLQKDASIVLLDDTLGRDQEQGEKSLAETFAYQAQRRVIAPVCPIEPSQVQIDQINPLQLFHPPIYKRSQCWRGIKNLFRSFQAFTG